MAPSIGETLRILERRWNLSPGEPLAGAETGCASVAAVVLADGTDAVLKIPMPHFEAEHEVEGLRFWNGDPTVRLVDADPEFGAMLLERCRPGTPLRILPEPQQVLVIAAMLRRVWRRPAAPHPFRPLSAMIDMWCAETLRDVERWVDPGLVGAGLLLMRELSRAKVEETLLATDLHAGNVLRAEREPWLAIDPKPFIGDPAYDATQHLFNCMGRMRRDPEGTMGRVADLLEVDRARVRLWTFARAAAGPRDRWDDEWSSLARAIAPCDGISHLDLGRGASHNSRQGTLMTRRMVWLLAVAPVCLLADDRADRDAIQSAIGALNERQWRAATITSDPKALAEFQRLLRRKNLTWQIRPNVGRPATVTAQHGMFTRTPVKAQAPSIELKNPRVVPGAVDLLGEDRAIAHAALVEYRGKLRDSTELVFTMKKEAGVWKIAELKVGPDSTLLAAPR